MLLQCVCVRLMWARVHDDNLIKGPVPGAAHILRLNNHAAHEYNRRLSNGETMKLSRAKRLLEVSTLMGAMMRETSVLVFSWRSTISPMAPVSSEGSVSDLDATLQ